MDCRQGGSGGSLSENKEGTKAIHTLPSHAHTSAVMDTHKLNILS